MTAEIKSSLVAKQRVLTENENETTFTTWQQSIMFHIAIDSKFNRFTDPNDLGKWQAISVANRGFRNDATTGENVLPQDTRMTAVQKATILKVLLGSVASFAPVISNKFITEQAKSLDEIFERLRGHFGIRSTGSRILDLAQINLLPEESYETLWERISSFCEDNLLKSSSGIKHLGVKIETNEIPTPTLQNILVVLWLRAINQDLPMMIKQRFSTQLKHNTLYSLREDISDALPSILAEMNNREYTVNLAKNFKQKKYNSNKYQPKKNRPTKPTKYCCLCEASGRPGADTHYLSECRYLPPGEKAYWSKIRDITPILSDSDSSFDDEASACAVTVPATNKVDVLSSPILVAKYNDFDAHLTLDTGAQINLIAEQECKRLNLDILPSLQKAAMADGITPIPTVGEVVFKCYKTHHTLIFKGLVVRKLSCAILAGQPFLALNDVFTRASKRMIYIKNCCEFRSVNEVPVSNNPVRLSTILKSPQKLCLLPEEEFTFTVPDEFKGQLVAVEPRCEAPSVSNVPGWLKCQIINSSLNGEINIKNNSTEPVLIKKHEQLAQLRPIDTSIPTEENVHIPQIGKIHSHTGPFSTTIVLDPGKIMSKNQLNSFHSTHEQFDTVFSPELGKYNGFSGPFEHKINIGSNIPPQSKGRNPVYSRNNLEELQLKIDELVSKGVLVKPEDVNINVEYVSPSFLVKKSNGGHRLVTAFNQLSDYVKPQPTAMGNVDSVLRQIAQWKFIIKSDITDAYYHIEMAKDSMKYTGIVSPFRGTYVYQRAVMGLPGSEASLECLLSRILGNLMMSGKVVKLADDLYLGADSIEDLLQIWKEVLEIFKKNNLKLKPSKTEICPTSTVILGWLWKCGTITATPHRLNTLAQCPPPETVHKLRSFVGTFKALSKVLPYHSDFLQDFDKLCATSKVGSEKINWTDELLQKFESAKSHLKSAKTITLPRRCDELQIVTDASSSGLAASLYSIRNGKPVLSGLYNAKRRSHQLGWLPCEVEALAITASVKHFSPFIVQSNHVTTVVTDSAPCVAAYNKLSRGEFSTSPRLTTFLSTLSHYRIKLKHIAGKKNIISDFASRNAIQCKGSCQICKFVAKLENSVVNTVTVEEITTGKCPAPYANHAAWSKLQKECQTLKRVAQLLRTGTKPGKNEKGVRDIKRYIRHAQLSSQSTESILIVPDVQPFQPSSQRIVVPRNMVHGLLTALHLKLGHPSKDQLKKVFNRGFFALSLDSAVENTVDSCHQCVSLAKVPSTFVKQSTSNPSNFIGERFSADIIKRERQLILLVREYVTSLTDAVMVKSESGKDLLEGLIKILSRLHSPAGPQCIVKVDPGTGFQSLQNNKSLSTIGITIEIGEPKNINKNPVSERAISEALEEFAKIQPSGGPISETDLSIAISRLNSKIRYSNLSAVEMWTKRSMSSGAAITLDDKQLIQNKQQERIADHSASSKYKARGKTTLKRQNFNKGDIVYLYEDRVKGKCRNHYLIADISEDHMIVQKFVNNQLRAKQYKIKIEQAYKAKVEPSREICSSESEEESHITINLKANPAENDHSEVDVNDDIEEEEVNFYDAQESSEEEESAEEFFCPICVQKVLSSDKALQCDTCDQWYHIKCCGLTDIAYEHQQQNEDASWLCPAHSRRTNKQLRSTSRADTIEYNRRIGTGRGQPPGFRTSP